MIYFIDFDGTVCPNGPPTQECINFINKLKQHNHTVVMYSCRSNPDCVTDAVKATNEMIKFLNYYKIPFDHIEPNKPFFNFIIDDRALGIPLDAKYNVDWKRLEEHYDRLNK